MAIVPPPALAGPLPLVTPTKGSEAMPIGQLARTIQTALDNVGAPLKANELIADKVNSAKTSGDVPGTLQEVLKTIDDWKNSAGKEVGSSDPLYLTMARIERLLNQQLVLHRTDTAIAVKMLKQEENQTAATEKLKASAEQQLGFFATMKKRADELAEMQKKQFEGKGQSDAMYDDGYGGGEGRVRGAIRSLSEGAQNYTGISMGVIKSAAKGLTYAGVVAAGILASASDIINGWLSNERAGTGKAISLLGGILGGSTVTAQLFRGYVGVTVGSKVGTGVGAMIGNMMGGPAGGILGAFAGKLIGAALGVSASVWMGAMGPERMTSIIKSLKDSTLRIIDKVFGSTLILDPEKIAEEKKTIEEALGKVKQHLTVANQNLVTWAKQRANLVEQLGKTTNDPEKTARLMSELAALQQKIKTEEERFETLMQQQKSLVIRLEQQIEDQREVFRRERNIYTKTLLDNGVKIEGQYKANLEAMIADQEAKLNAMRDNVMKEAGNVQDSAFQERLRNRMLAAKKAVREGFFGRILDMIDWGIGAIPDPDNPGKSRPVPKASQHRSYKDTIEGIQDPQVNKPKSEIPDPVKKMSMESSGRMSEVTKRLVTISNRFEELKLSLAPSGGGGQPTIINAPSPVNNVAMSSNPVSIFTKTDPRGVSDPMVRRSAFGYA